MRTTKAQSTNKHMLALSEDYILTGIQQRYKFACAPMEDSDQPTRYPRSLIRVVDGRSICADPEEETGDPNPL